MRVAVLEKDSVSTGDIDFSSLDMAAETEYFDKTDAGTLERIFAEFDGIVVNKTKIDGRLLEKSGKLKYIGLFATGFNNIDTATAKEKGITVCNVSGYSTKAVAQHVFMFVLAASGSFYEYVRSVKRGDWKRSHLFSYYPYPISEISGKTMGIIGYGNIGRQVANIAEAFGMKVLVNTGRDSGRYRNLSKEEVFSGSDFISIHCPLNEATAGMVNAGMLALMKPTAYLINTARGGIVNEKDLFAALSEKRIAGACLDTIGTEPMTWDFPLNELDNCLITPHVAWAARETRQRLVDSVAENIRNFMAGKPTNKVN